MKKLSLYSVLIILVSSCASLPSPKSTVYIVDYSVLTDKGLFVTESNSVSFEYDAIASLLVEETGGYVTSKSKYYDEVHNSHINTSAKKRYQSPNEESALIHLSEKLVSIGANGIINLNITSSIVYARKGDKAPVENITITGMAIKK